jgi:hypothetical protein
VLRTHLGQPVARGQIAVEPMMAAAAANPNFPAFEAAVEAELTRLGWTVVRTVGQSEQVALVDVAQGSREAISQRLQGAGGVPPAITRPPNAISNVVATLLEVRIKRRSDGTLFWDGRAQTEAPAGSAQAAPPMAVQKLAAALFQDFPGESGRTIRLK